MNEANEYTETTGPSAQELQAKADFAEFYYGIISTLYNLKYRQMAEEVKYALRNMRKYKHKTNITQEVLFAHHISYEHPPAKCAYLYAYSVLHSIMVYSEFSNLFKLNQNFLLPVCQRDSLKICCFGGGPGTEAVAICRSLNDIILQFCPKSAASSLKVHVTMIDKFPHWRIEELEVIDAVNNRSNTLHSKRIVVHYDFMKADLLKPFQVNLKKKITKADIVTIFKVGASIQEQKKNPESCITELQNMLRGVTESMRDDSFLFMLDNAGGSIFYSMKSVLQEKKHPSWLKSSLHKEYVLDRDTVIKFESLLDSAKDIRYPIPPTSRGKVSSCIWIKNTNSFTKKSTASSNKTEKTSNHRSTTSSVSEREKKEETGTSYNMVSVLVGRSKDAQYAVMPKNEGLEKENKRLKKTEARRNNNKIEYFFGKVSKRLKRKEKKNNSKIEYFFGEVNVELEVNVETSKRVWVQKV